MIMNTIVNDMRIKILCFSCVRGMIFPVMKTQLLCTSPEC